MPCHKPINSHPQSSVPNMLRKPPSLQKMSQTRPTQRMTPLRKCDKLLTLFPLVFCFLMFHFCLSSPGCGNRTLAPNFILVYLITVTCYQDIYLSFFINNLIYPAPYLFIYNDCVIKLRFTLGQWFTLTKHRYFECGRDQVWRVKVGILNLFGV